MNLRAVQDELKKLIFPREAAPAESPLWGKAVPDRLRVYRNNTRSNWQDTLDADFRLTQAQFAPEEWAALAARYFARHPAGHWELNASLAPFVKFLSKQGVRAWVKELADYEWRDLQIFIDRAAVRRGAGVTNPTATVGLYQHQIFYWVRDGAPKDKPPKQKPEVLLFYRDSRNSSHVCEADPLMLLLMDHFRKPGARPEDVEPVRRKLLPKNAVPLEKVLADLREREIIL